MQALVPACDGVCPFWTLQCRPIRHRDVDWDETCRDKAADRWDGKAERSGDGLAFAAMPGRPIEPVLQSGDGDSGGALDQSGLDTV